MSEHIALSMAAACTAGGLIGYFKTGSVISLVAGAGIGALYAYSGLEIKKNGNHGYDMAVGASLLLLGAMGPKAIRTLKPVPTTMSILGLASGAYYSKKAYEFRYGV
ncbi:hypothetical protein BB559_006597 [Furculomyces boomerangus]|uniref:Transmembrane protein 14C n=2 Tax=Harpellales TaxID=61421 RepID=A0A2T9Y1N4_9FUNG|nr:hypothetical protein BB559_006597 [Furculomyces boomerangus]PWA03749.1 hypothetical protein BB558_000089 [Smittium angustum]